LNNIKEISISYQSATAKFSNIIGELSQEYTAGKITIESYDDFCLVLKNRFKRDAVEIPNLNADEIISHFFSDSVFVEGGARHFFVKEGNVNVLCYYVKYLFFNIFAGRKNQLHIWQVKKNISYIMSLAILSTERDIWDVLRYHYSDDVIDLSNISFRSNRMFRRKFPSKIPHITGAYDKRNEDLESVYFRCFDILDCSEEVGVINEERYYNVINHFLNKGMEFDDKTLEMYREYIFVMNCEL